MRVSSGVKYAFASSCHRSPPNCDRGSALQRVQPCQSGLPTRTRRAWFERALLSRHHERRSASFERLRCGTLRSARRQGVQPAGYCHSRPTHRPGRGRLIRCRHRICHHAKSHGEAVVPSKTAFLDVGTPVLPSTAGVTIKPTARIPALKGKALRLLSRNEPLGPRRFASIRGCVDRYPCEW